LVRIGVIGCGYGGPNLVRTCFETAGVEVAGVSDLRADRLALVNSRYPSIQTTQNFRELIEDPTIDAVAIATPASAHYDLALLALQEGKHVLVEKPLASDADQFQRLMDLAEKRSRVLMVGHTFVYTDAVRKIRELVDRGTLGEVYYYDSVRVNVGLFQHDVQVLQDLAVPTCPSLTPCAAPAVRSLWYRTQPHTRAVRRTSPSLRGFVKAARSLTFTPTGSRR
jgi:predicted dehydrogenase